MKNVNIFLLVVFAIVNLQAQTTNIQEKLTELSRLGIQYKYLDETTIELSNSLTDYRSIKTIKEKNTQEIYSWANEKDIPVIDFDPALIDTNKWAGWYEYWTFVPISNGSVPFPVWAKDYDGNGFPEVYGIFGLIGLGESRVFEVYPDGHTVQRHNYSELPATASTQILDIDKNGLIDLALVSGQNTYIYEQSTTTSLPTQSNFTFTKYDGLANVLSREHMTYMDDDSLIDFVHRGADTNLTQVYHFYVSEYNPSIQNFEKKWFLAPDDDFYDGFDVGDYDGDNQMEFILSSLWGQIRIVENTGDNTYAVNFLDSLPLVNMYYKTSGDLDQDGKREFFIGATMGDGNWTVMFESDGDNTYTPKIILHLISGGSLDEPTYITEDINGDGKLELSILSGGYLYIFKSDGDNSYYLWYLKKGPASFQVSFYDMNTDGTKDIIWSSIRNDSWTSDIFRATELVSVNPDIKIIPDKIELMQNYPNPFNPSTTIHYNLPVKSNVQLKVFDILGKEVTTLVNEEKQAGSYSVEFNIDNLPAGRQGISSGLYIYQLKTEFGSISKKMLLLK